MSAVAAARLRDVATVEIDPIVCGGSPETGWGATDDDTKRATAQFQLGVLVPLVSARLEHGTGPRTS